MQRYICPDCGHERGIGLWMECPHGVPHGGLKIASIHPSERAVIYRNPRTGEIRTPPRNDMPIPEVYARQGYVREELSTHAAVHQFEKETGRLHEPTHYDSGSGRAERDLAAEPEIKKDPEVTRRLVQALRS